MSDCHWDAAECYLKLLHEHLGEAKDRKPLVIDAGDLYEVISGAGAPRRSRKLTSGSIADTPATRKPEYRHPDMSFGTDNFTA